MQRTSILADAVFLVLGLWQFIRFQMRPLDDFYQPHGYITKVNKMIRDGKIFYDRDRNAYRPIVKVEKLEPEEEAFFNQSWLKDDIQAFNDGNSDVFLIEK